MACPLAIQEAEETIGYKQLGQDSICNAHGSYLMTSMGIPEAQLILLVRFPQVTPNKRRLDSKCEFY